LPAKPAQDEDRLSIAQDFVTDNRLPESGMPF
jgi:hypothetical protein